MLNINLPSQDSSKLLGATCPPMTKARSLKISTVRAAVGAPGSVQSLLECQLCFTVRFSTSRFFLGEKKPDLELVLFHFVIVNGRKPRRNTEILPTRDQTRQVD